MLINVRFSVLQSQLQGKLGKVFSFTKAGVMDFKVGFI